jgi:hypothetical protein
MEMKASARDARIWGIVPPHILEAIAANSSDSAERRGALKSLATDTTLRMYRLSRQAAGLFPKRVPVPGVAPAKQRTIYTGGGGTTLPGTLVRTEGQNPTADLATDEAYDGLGATFDLYWNVFHRNSIDNAGLSLIGTVHYDQNYDNAFWDGSQMIFGDGDGAYFNRFTVSIDIMGHELTHGVTAHEASLTYQNQSGALNESISDVFGSMVKQYAQSPQQTSAEADWLIGAGLFTSRVNGVALRSMNAPGTAYDDLVIGKDPQPDNMSDYVQTTSDNGGVHINSGIPNRAFYLAAVALGGHSWEKAGPIWYATVCDTRLSPDAQFHDFANLTADNAARFFGDTEKQAIVEAWRQVGITVAGPTPGLAGDWVLHYSWGCDGNFSTLNLTFNSDGTIRGPETGTWVQQDGTILMSFDSGPGKYGGTLNGPIGSGAMSTFSGSNGCWYLSKVGTTGLAPQLARGGRAAPFDVAGNKRKSGQHSRRGAAVGQPA